MIAVEESLKSPNQLKTFLARLDYIIHKYNRKHQDYLLKLQATS